MRRYLSCLLLAVASVLPFATAAHAKPKLGIADNNAATFADARFQQLHLKYARINVPWDVMIDANTLPSVDAWMASVKLAGMQPLVSFDRSRLPGRQGVNPTNAQVVQALNAWRARWGAGFIKTISAWNEPNINKQPKPVAGWYNALRKACKGCTVMPGELVDRGNAVTYAQRVNKLAKHKASVWGLHSYIDANTFSTKNIKKFAKKVPGKIWLTETGGVVWRQKTTVAFKGTGVDFQTKATQYLLTKVAKSTKKLQRIYLYAWSAGDKAPYTWDSGLVTPDATQARPALNVVRKFLGLAPDLTATATK